MFAPTRPMLLANSGCVSNTASEMHTSTECTSTPVTYAVWLGMPPTALAIVAFPSIAPQSPSAESLFQRLLYDDGRRSLNRVDLDRAPRWQIQNDVGSSPPPPSPPAAQLHLPDRQSRHLRPRPAGNRHVLRELISLYHSDRVFEPVETHTCVTMGRERSMPNSSESAGPAGRAFLFFSDSGSMHG